MADPLDWLANRVLKQPQRVSTEPYVDPVFTGIASTDIGNIATGLGRGVPGYASSLLGDVYQSTMESPIAMGAVALQSQLAQLTGADPNKVLVDYFGSDHRLGWPTAKEFKDFYKEYVPGFPEKNEARLQEISENYLSIAPLFFGGGIARGIGQTSSKALETARRFKADTIARQQQRYLDSLNLYKEPSLLPAPSTAQARTALPPPDVRPALPAPQVSEAPTTLPGFVSVSNMPRVKSGKNKGLFIGSPHRKRPGEVNADIAAYASRIENTLDSGVKPGYFYEEGSKALTELSGGSPVLNRTQAGGLGITSSEAPVQSNAGWMFKALEQEALGAEIKTGLYPKQQQPYWDALFGEMKKPFSASADWKYLGTKRGPYAEALELGGKGGKGPNDRWEISSVFKNKVDATDAQHAYIDAIRANAVGLVNERRRLNLTVQEGQELNWATAKATGEKTTPAQVATQATIQDSIPYYTAQHHWESKPGDVSGHLPNLAPDQLIPLHKSVREIFIDDRNRDRLVEALGGRLQPPAYDAQGVFEGKISPGTTSRSLAHHAGGVVNPLSKARIEATESVRGLMLGQDAIAGTHIVPARNKAPDAFQLINVPHTDDNAKFLAKAVENAFGDAVAVTPTPDGFNIISLWPIKGFAKTFGNEVGPAIKKKISGVSFADGRRIVDDTGAPMFYHDLPWKEGKVTEQMLARLDNPIAPKLAQLAEAPELRQMMGQLATLYESGKYGTANQGIIRVLRAWKKTGLPGVRALVAKGLAPAAALAILAPHSDRKSSSLSGRGS